MEFKTNKPIYQQIVDFCFSKILTREWRVVEEVTSGDYQHYYEKMYGKR